MQLMNLVERNNQPLRVGDYVYDKTFDNFFEIECEDHARYFNSDPEVVKISKDEAKQIMLKKVFSSVGREVGEFKINDLITFECEGLLMNKELVTSGSIRKAKDYFDKGMIRSVRFTEDKQTLILGGN